MNETPNIEKIIKNRKNKLAIKKGYINLLMRVVLIAMLVFILFNQAFLMTRVTGNDMFPAVRDGDLIIGFRLQQNFEKNDVVTYQLEGERKIGRFIARESDVVTLDDTGILLVNGVVQSGAIVYPTFAKEGIDYPYTVPEDHMFILGDYRTQTADSRDFGAIPIDDVEGKVITLLRRRDL